VRAKFASPPKNSDPYGRPPYRVVDSLNRPCHHDHAAQPEDSTGYQDTGRDLESELHAAHLSIACAEQL
jgi:hypothetical protein